MDTAISTKNELIASIRNVGFEYATEDDRNQRVFCHFQVFRGAKKNKRQVGLHTLDAKEQAKLKNLIRQELRKEAMKRFGRLKRSSFLMEMGRSTLDRAEAIFTRSR